MGSLTITNMWIPFAVLLVGIIIYKQIYFYEKDKIWRLKQQLNKIKHPFQRKVFIAAQKEKYKKQLFDYIRYELDWH